MALKDKWLMAAKKKVKTNKNLMLYKHDITADGILADGD